MRLELAQTSLTNRCECRSGVNLTIIKRVIPAVVRPSSFRRVVIRDIGAGAHLYPALQACGVTEVCVEAPETSSGIMLIEFIRIIPEFISGSSTPAVT